MYIHTPRLNGIYFYEQPVHQRKIFQLKQKKKTEVRELFFFS